MNTLKDTRCYLAGAMSLSPDNGVEWREDIKPFLKSLGVRIFDPCSKPINIGPENLENRERHRWLRTNERFDELSKLIRIIRDVDLMMVNTVDFLIVNLDTSIHTCGTWEEVFLANREKKPILVHIEQGKQATPLWLFGTIPHWNIFSSWRDIKDYIIGIDSGNIESKRFYLFDHSRT